ncbi:MAG: NUDIX hydrolase [Propionibacteriaceae bacterium]|nr:NUDIX hydrolase [Propionibacteriaceae bacterium]
MNGSEIIYAGGTVTLRPGKDGEPEVLLVHRKRYDDWSLPKGKLDRGECLPVCAVRETKEETGMRPILGAPLDLVEYPVLDGLKRVYYWAAWVGKDRGFEPNSEVDKIKWLPLEKACAKTTYPEEPAIIRQALELGPTIPFLVVRHAQAEGRIGFSGPDEERPLAKRGRQQAKRLRKLLRAYGVSRLVASSATRTMQTFLPYSKAAGIPIVGEPAFTESATWDNPRQADAVLEELLRIAVKDHAPTAVCGHAPGLPAMLDMLGVQYRPMSTATAVIVHFNEAGEAIATEHFDSPPII